MKPFSEEEQAERRRPLLRSPRGRRIAAYAALPLGFYAALTIVSLLGGPRLPLVPVPGPGAPDAISPVTGPPSARSSERAYPPIPADATADPTAAPTTAPTRTPTPEPPGRQSTEGAADRPVETLVTSGSGDPARPTSSLRPMDQRTGVPTPQATRTPPTRPTTTPTADPPDPTPTTTSTPTAPPRTPGTPDDNPTLGDTLLALLDALIP